MAKKSAIELFEQYYTTLVFSLPIKDPDFIDGLLKHNLLPGDLQIKLQSLAEHDKKSSYFLDNIITPGLVGGNSECFVSLLMVMRNSKHDNIKELAKRIEEELIKCKFG